MKQLLFVMPWLLAVVPAQAQTTPEAADDISRASYACEGGKTMEVVFLNTAAGNSYAVVMAEDQLIPMQIAPSGSGARYLALGEQPTHQLWTAKGGGDLVALDGTQETPLRTGCTLTDEPAPR